MVFRMFAAAIAAGLLAAVLITGLQAVITTPLILKAETYESTAPNHGHGDEASHGHGEDDHGEPGHHDDATSESASEPESEWMPEDGIERLFYTFIANCGAGIGFSLLLVVGLSFDLPAVSATRGVMWGIAGYAVFTLAPALGLPPGAPGMAVPDEKSAQIWWLVTVVLSAAGIGCLVFGKTALFKLLGPVLLAAPHIWGAPHGFGDSLVPAMLAAKFAASAIVLSGVFWITMGYFSGSIFARLNEKEGAG